MRPGQHVVAKAFGGKLIHRIVVQVIGTTVVICKREEWDAAQKQNRSAAGVGFPVYKVKVVESGKKC